MSNVSLFLFLTSSSLLFLFASAKHFLLGSSAWDLGIFEQFSWLISNGYLFHESSLRGIQPLQDHFSLLLFPIALIYKYIPSPYTLLFLQSTALGSVTSIIYSYCRRVSFNPNLTKSILIASILSPIVFLVNIANFHPEVLAVPFMVATLLYSKRTTHNLIFYLSLIISLVAKKSQLLFGLGVAIYLYLNGYKRKSFLTLTLSILWWIIASHYSKAGGDYIQGRLGYLGEDIPSILFTLIASPWEVFKEAPPDTIVLYLLGLSLPFLALWKKGSLPAIVSTFPILFTNIISNTGTQRELYSQYSISILPFLIVSCIDSFSIYKLKYSVKRYIFLPTLLLTIIAFLGYSRIGYFYYRYLPRFEQALEVQSIKPFIHPNHSILTTDHLAAHFAGRYLIHNIEDSNYTPLTNYNYILLPKPELNFHQSSRIINIIKSVSNKTHDCTTTFEFHTVCKSKD